MRRCPTCGERKDDRDFDHVHRHQKEGRRFMISAECSACRGKEFNELVKCLRPPQHA